MRARGALLAVLACSLLAGAHAAPDQNNTRGKICPTLDIRNSATEFVNLNDCRVIEGDLVIVLMEHQDAGSYENVTFPKLVEVTGYMLVYRVRGLKNLGKMFPNLTVVRGMHLFKDFALVIFDNPDLEAVGLRSLMAIERGGVRIERNDILCYVNTIDWKKINIDKSENVIKSNYDLRFCGLCPNAKGRTDEELRHSPSQCPTDSTRNNQLLCWDGENCQKICNSTCGTRGCHGNECCHPQCLGGCDGPKATDCRACRHFLLEGKENEEPRCVDKCPRGNYELFRRCVTEEVCRSQPEPTRVTGTPGPNIAASIRAYKIHNESQCVYICPSGYMEVGDKSNATCQLCSDSGSCTRKCDGGKIDSVANAELFRGCTHINGKVEISLRSGGDNLLSTLESCLGEIREINGSLQVTHSYPLVSLMFLKNLKKIYTTDYKGKVLYILNNPNLELLWQWDAHGPLEISGGAISVQNNPKLCYHHILPLKDMMNPPVANFTDTEVSTSNGNEASCLPNHMSMEVLSVSPKAVVLTWDKYCPRDMRKLIGFSVYYIATKENISLYERRDACSDSWSVVDMNLEDASNGTDKNATQNPFEKCSSTQRHFRAIASLTPYTRYAAYVKTFTASDDEKGAQSPIIYFTTMPTQPSPPDNLGVELLDPHSVNISWGPPLMPNGTIFQYLVEVQANSYNEEQIFATRGSSESCTNPNTLSNLIAIRLESTKTLAPTPDKYLTNNGTCDCDGKNKQRFTSVAEEDRQDSINFENDLQNWVYRKSKKVKNTTQSRNKRSIGPDSSMNRMLVKMTENIVPTPGKEYHNSSDSKGYVKSQYHKLDGNARSVTILSLRHFTWYTVSVWACRTNDMGEPADTWEKDSCSERTFNTFLTKDKANADVVTDVKAVLAATNKTVDLMVNWKPPSNPNGFVVAYDVHYSKVDNDYSTQDVGFHSCVSPREYLGKGLGTTLRGVAPGNYSIKVTPITVKGLGNASADVFIAIPEKSTHGYEWIWGVAIGCLVMILILVGVFWYVKRGFMPNAEAHKLFASVNPEYVSTVYVPDEWEVPRANIEFIRELGQGSFGMVYEGIAKNLEKGKPETRCAVKTVNEHATDRERVEFLNEASVMKAFDTFHVVRLMGVVSRGQPTLVVMELMELGDLKTYLRSHRPDSESSLPKKDSNNTPPTLQNILQMAIEIADGMAYLSAKKFVHRDLAARNCMVAGDLTVKVGDFGMTRDIYETDYYRKGTKGLLPVRWMSPESLKDGVFSSNSDAWSYGVVLWEMATLAMQPYQGLSNEQVVRYVVEGGVMERPEHCPDRLYELMRACWAHRPAARPSFLHLAAELAPSAAPYYRHRSFFHSPLGQELYALQRSALEEEQEVVVGAVATGSGSNLFGVSSRLASWVRELSSVRSRASDDAAAEPLQPLHSAPLKGPNGVLRELPPP